MNKILFLILFFALSYLSANNLAGKIIFLAYSVMLGIYLLILFYILTKRK